jgi:integrase
MTLYDTGMRRAELCQLRPEHIDKERMIIRIPHGKGGKVREFPLSSRLREQLRTYYRSLARRNGWRGYAIRGIKRQRAPRRVRPR